MKYLVSYYFDGSGEVWIEAKNRKQAEEKFYEGEFWNEKEWGETYCFDHIINQSA